MARILVVDDQEELRSLLATLLSGTYDVVTAENGLEALAQVAEKPVDAVVLDLEMPKLDGAGFMRELRAQGRTCRVLVCSAHIDIETRAREIGASDHLAKPFSTAVLRAKLDALLGDSPRVVRLSAQRPEALAAQARSAQSPRRKSLRL